MVLSQSIHTVVHRCLKVHVVVKLVTEQTISVLTDRVDLVVVAVDAEQEV